MGNPAIRSRSFLVAQPTRIRTSRSVIRITKIRDDSILQNKTISIAIQFGNIRAAFSHRGRRTSRVSSEKLGNCWRVQLDIWFQY